MFRDYYLILGVSTNATSDEIKSAYRSQAKKWHPDRNPEKDTTQRMQEIVEAYLILNDSEARQRYDASYRRYYQEKEQFNQNASFKTRSSGQNHQKQQENKKESTSAKEKFHFEVDDELLKRWMNNAKEQAKTSISNVIHEFAESSAIGFSTLGSTIIKGVIVFVIIKLIATLIILLNN